MKITKLISIFASTLALLAVFLVLPSGADAQSKRKRPAKKKSPAQSKPFSGDVASVRGSSAGGRGSGALIDSDSSQAMDSRGCREAYNEAASKLVSFGVVNGKAVHLEKPVYPEAAKAVKASGAVSVQVLIGEDGQIILACATSGHPLLREASENAAKASTFTPVLLGGYRVKVAGAIVYNFVVQ